MRRSREGNLIPGYLLEQELYEGHYRVLKVEYPDSRLYSIDVYMPLEGPVECSGVLESSGVRLCYTQVSPGCEAVVVEAGGRRELVSLRLITTIQGDPAGGSLSAARDYCLTRLMEWLKR